MPAGFLPRSGKDASIRGWATCSMRLYTLPNRAITNGASFAGIRTIESVHPLQSWNPSCDVTRNCPNLKNSATLMFVPLFSWVNCRVSLVPSGLAQSMVTALVGTISALYAVVFRLYFPGAMGSRKDTSFCFIGYQELFSIFRGSADRRWGMLQWAEQYPLTFRVLHPHSI